MRRYWFRRRSDGTFFRNTSLVMDEMQDWRSQWIPGRMRRLGEELAHLNRVGWVCADSIGRRDRFYDHDDTDPALLETVIRRARVYTPTAPSRRGPSHTV